MNRVNLLCNSTELMPERFLFWGGEGRENLCPLFSLHAGLEHIVSFNELVGKIGHEDFWEEGGKRGEEREGGVFVAHANRIAGELACGMWGHT